jgi:PEP-CTERM motif
MALPAPNTPVSSLTQAGFTVTFTSPDAGTVVTSRANVPVGWGTWNSPPAVESSTPPVLQDSPNLTCVTCTLNLGFSNPVTTFGLEMEQDPNNTAHTISATFLNGGATVGNITIPFAGGISTARLFAANATGADQFTSVKITIDGTDFAMAQLRFGGPITGIPEPGTVMLMLGGLAAIGFRKFRRS